MADIGALVAKAVSMGQPAISLTDHGNMSGVFQLYKEARKHDILPFLGIEPYYVDDLNDKKAKRHHMTLLSYTTDGYKNLAGLSSLSHNRDHYHYKPRLDRRDLIVASGAGGTKGIACLTGCYFGLVCQAIVNADSEEEGLDAAERIVRFLKGIFSPVYIEVQHHKTDGHNEWDDDRLVRALYKLALMTGTTPIITNDCHYCDKSDKHLHDMMKSIAYSSDISEVSFPGDSYHLATEQWVKMHYRAHEDVWAAAQDSYHELLDIHDLSIPVLDSYQYHVPTIAKSPSAELKRLCEEALAQLGLSNDYQARLDYELGVVHGLGMSDYFLLVHDYVEWCHDQGIFVMARGSAAGSLICWLLGFTQVDPIKWNLTFDRFLTPDRVRPPDIDLDIEDTRRADVIEYLKGKYEIIQIGTYNKLAYDEDTGRGGLFVQYISAQRKILGDRFPKVLGRVKTLHDLDEVRPKDARRLRDLGGVALRRSPGAHAAGFVVSAPPDHSISEWLPTMLIPSSDTEVTQMMMDDVEDAGYIKIDLLGLRSLTTVHRCLQLIGRDDLDWIPLDDGDTFKFLRKGNAETGIFQMEGYTAAKGCREVKVKSVKDLILVNALYRPATRDSGYVDMFLNNRRNPKSVTYTHSIFKKHLQETYGVPCFQEQVLAILRDLGMPAEELNAFLKAVKGKHAKAGYSAESTAIFDRNRERFSELCRDAGMTEAQVESSWELVEGFAAYGFNRAHATAYSLLGYQMAYLKVHYPVAFHAALLETSVGTSKEDQYVKETRRVGVPVLGACVNRSKVSWAMDPSGKAVRRGLSAIKGIGYKAADAIVINAPYSTVEDLIERCPASAVTGGKSWGKDGTLNGVMEALRKAGALKQLGVMP
jgi:DNA polymerase-3 subunit alpha